ncbi:MAG: Uma2 family endonuclease [Chloroflexi bacterium]|nr:Uma2 family endonuclease [Chloroflexota bacterium]
MAEAIVLPPRKRGWPKQGEWTYDDYLKLPDDGRRYEIIEGELYVTNAPGLDHQFVVAELLRQMANYVVENQLGRVITAPFEVHLSETIRPVQPDVLFIKKERWPGPGAKFFSGVPDLIVEVLSPSTARRDRIIKFTAYEQAGVPEYWIANPRTHSVEVFTLSGAEYALVGEFIEAETIQSKMLPDLQIITASLFGD